MLSGIPEFPRHMKNTYASETPTTDGERVYVRFGELGLFTFDMDGHLVWSKPIPFRQTRSDWGSASSPRAARGPAHPPLRQRGGVVDRGTGQAHRRGAVANGARRGLELGDAVHLEENDLRTEIVTSGVQRIRSYDLDGQLLWDMDGRMSWAAIATPFSSHGLLYVNSGYFRDEHRPAYAIRSGASGDITLQDGETANTHVAWYQPRAGNYNTSPLVYGDIYYSLLDRGFFESYDARTGEPVYGRQRVRVGSSFTASPWAYNGKIFGRQRAG